MNKRAISVTLSEESLVWLRSETITERGRSLSDMLDQLVKSARGNAGARRSVVGQVEISDDDPTLESADAALQDAFAFPRSVVQRCEVPKRMRRRQVP
jgi:hypothetical protein